MGYHRCAGRARLCVAVSLSTASAWRPPPRGQPRGGVVAPATRRQLPLEVLGRPGYVLH
jgi:hypothetical protein